MPQDLIKIKKFQGIYYRESTKNRHQGKPDRCYYTTYRDNSKKFVREKVGWASEGYTAQLAAQIRSERIRAIRHGEEIQPKKKAEMTFGEAWERYEAWIEGARKTTRHEKARYKKYLQKPFSKLPLSKVSPDKIEKLKSSLFDEGLSPATTKHVLIIIRQVYNKMIDLDLWQGRNPVKNVKLPRLNNARERFLTFQEANNLLMALRHKSQNLYEISLLSLHTGMRAGEIFGLRWGHIDTENGLIHIADPKGGDPRKAVMTGTVKEVLQEKNIGLPGSLVFEARGGGMIKGVSAVYYRTVKELGFNDGIDDRRQLVSFHTLRTPSHLGWLSKEPLSLKSRSSSDTRPLP